MCTYLGGRVIADKKIRLKNIEKTMKAADLNIAVQSGFDYADWLVIKPNADYSDWDFAKMEWGFLPFYLRSREEVEKFRKGYKDANGKYHAGMTTLNAKGEEMLLPGKLYRESALKRRCLVPASHFYEWRHIFPIGKKGLPLKTAVKYPYAISVKNCDCFFIAAVWQAWTDKATGETIDTFALVTTDANSMMKQIHNSKNRMPVILTEALAEQWITNELSEDQLKQTATYQFDPSLMSAHTIKKDFRAAVDPLEAFAYEEVPELV